MNGKTDFTHGKFLNKTLYTDVNSYYVFDIDEKAGTAMAAEVERDFIPEMAAGGFSTVCVNNSEYCYAPIVFKKGCTPFKIICKKGVWGFMHVCGLANDAKSFNPDFVKEVILGKHPGVMYKDGCIICFEMTKTGKPKMTFEKLGQLSDKCLAYYDFNF